MIDFSKVAAVNIPAGNVVAISSGGVSLWGGMKKFNYVSFGDSIAVGHRIDSNWITDYGWDAQYGVGGRTETTLVPGCYTDIIRQDLESIYGENRVSVVSFARSGDTVSDLLTKLTHDRVQSALRKADLVTISIGANDVLDHALACLEGYLTSGDSTTVDGLVENALNILNDDSHPGSYFSLFERLNEINPDAKYVFTTVYNPYKHLHIVEGSGQGAFLYHLLNNIPRLPIDIDRAVERLFGIDDLGIWNIAEWRWVSLELEVELGQIIKDGLVNTKAVKTLFKSVNTMGTLAEGYIDGNDRFIGLDPILRSKIASYRETHPNFVVADTKKLFDLFPSLTESRDDVDYSDLVNVEFSEGYDVAIMDWGALWRDDHGTAEAYYTYLANKYCTFQNALPSTDAWDYVSFDLEAFAAELVDDVISKVIEPNIDPHPEHHGQQVLKRSFTNMFGLTKYDANGGVYVAGDVVLNGGIATTPDAIKGEEVFGGWCTDVELQNALNPFSRDFVSYDSDITLSELVSGNTIVPKLPKVTPLYAKWIEPNDIVVKNLVPLIRGTTGFNIMGSGGTYCFAGASTEHTKYTDRSLKMAVGSDYNELYAISTSTYPLDSSHIYYARVEAYQEVASGSMEMYFPIAEPQLFNTPAQEAGKWNTYSSVCDRSAFSSGDYTFRLDFNRDGGPGGEVWYDGLMLIDLTEAFGAGNEPSKEWCDENIPYFTGSTTLYTPKQYVQTDGAQYIDTGFLPNNNTRIVIDIEHLVGDDASVAFYGYRDNKTATSSTKSFVGWQRSGGTSFNFHYGQSANIVQSPTGTNKGRFLIDHNKAVVTINGTKFNLKGASDFQADDSMFLLAARTAGELDSQIGPHRLYSCRIYDDGTLVRDFVPAKRTSDGAIGLWDAVNNKFYGNAGSGSFTTAQ